MFLEYEFCHLIQFLVFFTTARSARQKGRGQHVAIKGEVEGMLRNQSCDWLTRFMKVILLGLSLVNTNLQVL